MNAPTKRDIEATFGQRVYEYTDQDGVTFYSFTRLPERVSLVRRLELKSRLGTHVTNFLLQVRRLSLLFGMQEGDDG